MEKYFITTIDTEADWFSFKENQVTNIFGVHYLQELCDIYNIKPTYLITYEIATKSESVSVLKKFSDQNLCEIGHHLHVWSTPPFFKPNEFGVEESLLEGIQAELPEQLFSEKMLTLHKVIERNFGVTPRSHRAGKWGVDNRTLSWLEEHNYIADSSLAPYNILNKVKGVKKTLSHNGVKIPNHPYYPSKHDISKISSFEDARTLLEVPVTGIKGDFLKNLKGASLIRSLLYKCGYKGVGSMMFRPSDIRIPLNVFEHVARKLFESEIQWVNFMFHSNELCLGTSPYSKKKSLNEKVRSKIECAFRLAKEYHFTSIFLKDSLVMYKKGHDI